jgi:hypothetical protein
VPPGAFEKGLGSLSSDERLPKQWNAWEFDLADHIGLQFLAGRSGCQFVTSISRRTP